MMPSLRLLPYSIDDGPHNMAADEVLLASGLAGQASLRLYGWSEATVSLGYFQPHQIRLADARVAGLPFVRRPSGGAALIHHHEVTYAVALPPGPPWQTGASWLCRMHDILAAALASLGVAASACTPAGLARFTGLLCFQHVTRGDLLIASAKIAGSAQRRQRGALLQHGALLLAGSPHAPALPGILDLTGRKLSADEVCRAVVRSFAQATGWQTNPSCWTAREQDGIEEAVRTRFAQASWNCKR
jgi:lipoate-protein ligase A